MAVCIALQVNYPSNQEEQETHAQQHGRLLVDLRQRVGMDKDRSMSACHPLEQRGETEDVTVL